MPNLNWKQIMPKIQDALRYFRSQSVTPTLRTLYYNLVSQNIIPNTKPSYAGLSKHLVEARKNGSIDWNAIADNVRTIKENFRDSKFDENIIQNTQDTLNYKLNKFNIENILRDFFDYSISNAYVSKWANQPETVEIWIEKDALAGTIEAWTRNHDVTIRVNKGYSSWTFLYNNACDLQEILNNNHEHINILYLGDLDPSGCDMERYLKEALNYFGLDDSQVSLVRLGITPEQVEQYHLPPKPEDAETLQKLARDPRNANYQHDYIVELDSLVAYVPDEFRNILISKINEYYDQTIYDDLQEQADEINTEIATLLKETKEKAKQEMQKFLKSD